MKHQTPDSMKFKRFCRRLGISPAVAVGTLELLWIATQKEAPRGDIGKFTDEDIAIAVHWDGDPSELVEALVSSGWLDRHPVHRLLVHDWRDHAPRYVHGIVAKLGGFITTEADCSGGLQCVTTEADCREGQPNLTKPNLTSNEASASSATPADADDAELNLEDPAVLEFPTVAGKKTKAQTWILRQSLVTELQELFPDLDVPARCRSALAWVKASSSRRKTAGRMRAFITGWLERAQNDGPVGSRGSPSVAASSSKPVIARPENPLACLEDDG